jgi:YD repeat-containing protein
VRCSDTLTNGEYRLTGTSQCQTTSSCSGGSDEVVTSLAYDANGNVTSFRNRAGETISFTFDPLNRVTAKDLPRDGTAGLAIALTLQAATPLWAGDFLQGFAAAHPFRNLIAYGGIGILAGMFSDQAAGWLSDRSVFKPEEEVGVAADPAAD